MATMGDSGVDSPVGDVSGLRPIGARWANWTSGHGRTFSFLSYGV